MIKLIKVKIERKLIKIFTMELSKRGNSEGKGKERKRRGKGKEKGKKIEVSN